MQKICKTSSCKKGETVYYPTSKKKQTSFFKTSLFFTKRSYKEKKKFLHLLPNVIYRKRRNRRIIVREKSHSLLQKFYFFSAVKRKTEKKPSVARTYKRKNSFRLKLRLVKRFKLRKKYGPHNKFSRRRTYRRMRPQWKHNSSSFKLRLLQLLRKQKLYAFSCKKPIKAPTTTFVQTPFSIAGYSHLTTCVDHRSRLKTFSLAMKPVNKVTPTLNSKNIYSKLPSTIQHEYFRSNLVTQKTFFLLNNKSIQSKNVGRSFSTWARITPKKRSYIRSLPRTAAKKTPPLSNKYITPQRRPHFRVKKKPFTFKRWKWRFPRWKRFPRLKKSLPRIYWQTQDLFPYRLYRRPHQPYRHRKPWQQKKNIRLRLLRQKTKWGRLLRRSEFITLQRRYFQIYSNFYGPLKSRQLKKSALHFRRSSNPHHSNLTGALTWFDHHLDVALCRTRLAPTLKVARLLINQGYVRVNGVQTRNIHKRVQSWDLVQITLESDYFFGKYWYSRNKYQRHLYKQTKNRFKHVHPKKLILPFGFFTRYPRLTDLPRYDRLSWHEFGRLLLI
jgi:ribosomal protein S4